MTVKYCEMTVDVQGADKQRLSIMFDDLIETVVELLCW